MKKSLITPQLFPTPPPSTRREVMKKGLGLTLGSSALGLATLGAPTAAQAWGSWHNTTYLNNYQTYDLWKYFDSALTQGGFFRGYGWNDIQVKWRNSNNAMWKDGYVYINDSRGNIATFPFNFNQYNVNGYKDYVKSSMTISRQGYSPVPQLPDTNTGGRELQEKPSEDKAIVNYLNDEFIKDPKYAPDFVNVFLPLKITSLY